MLKIYSKTFVLLLERSSNKIILKSMFWDIIYLNNCTQVCEPIYPVPPVNKKDYFIIEIIKNSIIKDILNLTY